MLIKLSRFHDRIISPDTISTKLIWRLVVAISIPCMTHRPTKKVRENCMRRLNIFAHLLTHTTVSQSSMAVSLTFLDFTLFSSYAYQVYYLYLLFFFLYTIFLCWTIWNINLFWFQSTYRITRPSNERCSFFKTYFLRLELTLSQPSHFNGAVFLLLIG